MLKARRSFLLWSFSMLMPTVALATSGRRQGKQTRDVGWPYSYTPMIVDGCAYLILRINLRFHPNLGWDKIKQYDYKLRMFDAVENLWNDKYSIKLRGNVYPCRVKIWFAPPFDKEVIVWPKTGRTNMGNFYEADVPQWIAHEVGHMLGLYDEYPGGFVHKDTVFTATGLMGSGAHDPVPVMFPRYYDPWLEGFPGATLHGRAKRIPIQQAHSGKNVRGSKKSLETAK